MEWARFLTDAELNDTEKFHHLPDGEYLFGKTLHDVRDCLTTYRGYVKIIIESSKAYSATTLNMLIRWDNTVEEWYAQTIELNKHLGKYVNTSIEWAGHIAEIGKIVQGVPDFQAEITAITPPEEDEARQWLQGVKRNAAALHLIWQDIQAQNYKRLWVTEKYRELISTDDL